MIHHDRHTDRPHIDTLTIRVEDSDAFDERVLDSLGAIDDDGRDLEPALSVSLPDAEALSRVLSPANLELIRAIAADTPESIRETAALVSRDVKDVHRNLTELAELGVIELVQDGKAKRLLYSIPLSIATYIRVRRVSPRLRPNCGTSVRRRR